MSWSSQSSISGSDVTVQTTGVSVNAGWYTRTVTVTLVGQSSPEQQADYKHYDLGVPVGGLFSFEAAVASVDNIAMT